MIYYHQNMIQILPFKYSENSFRAFFTLQLPSDVSIKSSTFCLFVFIKCFSCKFSIIDLISDLKFYFLDKLRSPFFSLEILIFCWVLEFTENVLEFSLKQDLVYFHQSLAEKWLFFVLLIKKKQILCNWGEIKKLIIKLPWILVFNQFLFFSFSFPWFFSNYNFSF